MSFNDGVVSLVRVLEKLDINYSPICCSFLRRGDKLRMNKSSVKAYVKEKHTRRAVRHRRKGYEDHTKGSEGVMYAPGAFDCPATTSKV